MSSRKGKFVGIYFESLIEGEDCFEKEEGDGERGILFILYVFWLILAIFYG